VVENRGGANAIIGAEVVAKAPPDGYSLLMGQIASHAAAPHFYKNLSYDPIKDFNAVTLVAKAPFLLLAHPSLPAETLGEFIEYAKKQPGQLRYSAAASGTGSSLTMAMFRIQAGLDLLYVPYKGNAAALTALLSREAHVSFSPVPVAMPHVSTRRLKGYAISSQKRFTGAPEIPTMDEQGVSGFESTTWFGLLTPARTPNALLTRLNHDVVQILKAPSLTSVLVAAGAEAAPGSPEEFSAFIKSETLKWGKVIKATGITAE
jgi:tripartite-type tricarboxylate transporter receptor subunit TctC